MKLLNNPRERFLFVLLVSVLAVLTLGIGGNSLLQRRAYVENQLFRLRSENLELRSWIADKPLILARQAWLEEHLQPSGDIRRNGLELLETLEKQAQAAGLQITAKTILDPQTGPKSTLIPIRVSAQGEFRNLAVFLHAVQKPGEFVMLKEIGVKAGSGAREVIADLEFQKFFRVATPRPDRP